jgi:thioredoxin-dependent peroxiredoxin
MRCLALFAVLTLGNVLIATALAQSKAPAVGEKAPDFALKDVEGKDWKLGEALARGPVVLVVLRGFPGYQCPVCNAQAGEFLGQAKKLRATGAQVVFVYPGPADKLTEKAKEFLKEKSMPESFRFLVDPDYTFTNAYSLRWNQPRETAYPATFVIDRGGIVRFALVSTTHGGRSKAADVLEALGKL